MKSHKVRTRKKRRRARIDSEHREVKTMINEPQGNAGTDKTDKVEGSTAGITSTGLRFRKESSGKSQQEDSAKKGKYSQHVTRLLVSVGILSRWAWNHIVRRCWNRLLGFADKHSAAIQAIATAVIAALTVTYVIYSRGQWRVAQVTLRISNRAYVSIGRKDGVVADFVIPKDPKQNAEIIIYFQNSGHLPAKFAWGTIAPFLLAPEGKKKSTGITYTHPFNGGFGRTKDIKAGTVGERGISTIIPGDSVFVQTLGAISQSDLAELPSNQMGLLIWGMYQYCDGFGNNFLRTFQIRYRSNAPSTSLSFSLVGDMESPQSTLPVRKGTIEYLPPCESVEEQEYHNPSK